MVPKWGPLGELTPINIHWVLCYQSPCSHSKPQATPTSSAGPLRPLGKSSPGSYGATALCWVPVHMRPCVCPPRMEFLFPPALWSSCTQAPGFQGQMLCGFFLPMTAPQTVLEDYFYVGMSLCDLHRFNLFFGVFFFWCEGCFWYG